MGYRVAGRDDYATNHDARFCRDDSAGEYAGQIWPDEKVWFAQMLRAVWPVKSAMAVVQYCAIPERTARNYCSAHSEPPATVLRDLLSGDEGDKVLDECLRHKPPAWWVKKQREASIGRQVIAIVEGNGNVFTGMHNGR